ncbi:MULTISPECIES: BCD family MFS transporter [unclassified Coleofasciculus]|uniref:BCD family MFS transporter n=1 Tax=unclassified Coleofasciculus TaxID=2692782 RepID=UPI001882EC40|nr:MULTISPECIES: BCD family MFS transporter [unclassified Coleofasciculus]MBE9125586.1 BCD family MFS transporter [Coleofasciculus sp. LEGE 07081]MBE9147300.1 BCD family MFS transporter [Coleofasciculus sp. LEGE 07092]
MNTSDFAKSQPTGKTKAPPKINLLMMFRLGLFQMGLGILTVLTVGVLNRVMIAELAIPAGVTSIVLAISQFVAPTRIWFGQMSDAKPLFGYHRTGYVWIGAALFALILSLSVQVVWQLGNLVQVADGWQWTIEISGWTALLALLMALYGLAVSASSTPFFTLLVDVSDEDNRGQLIGIVWSMMTVGLAVGGITSKVLLNPLDDINASIELVRSSISWLFVVVPIIVLGLAFVATVGVEKKYSRYASRSRLVDREDQITLGRALKILTASRQTGLFFTFLVVMTLSLFLQEAVLEPYGGEVFGMPIPETSFLNTYWALGMLVSLSATGFFLIPRFGKRRTTQFGCISVAFCFILIILSGFTGNVRMLQGALVLFGLFTGVLTTGALSLMLDLTAAEAAGTFVGAWGLAQAMARGLAVASGGIILSVGEALFAKPALAYDLVFGLQALGMIVAVGLLNRVNVREFQDNANRAIATVMESDLD